MELGEGKKLGKTLTQHILMRNLLNSSTLPHKQVTAATQTDRDFCFCGRELTKLKTQVQKQIKKFSSAAPTQQAANDYANLMQSIKQRMRMEASSQHGGDDDSSQSWSDCQSMCTECQVKFPKETKNAMKMMQSAPLAAAGLNRLYADGDSIIRMKRRCSSARSYSKKSPF